MRGFVDFSLFSKRVAQVLFWEAPHFQNKFPARKSHTKYSVNYGKTYDLCRY